GVDLDVDALHATRPDLAGDGEGHGAVAAADVEDRAGAADLRAERARDALDAGDSDRPVGIAVERLEEEAGGAAAAPLSRCRAGLQSLRAVAEAGRSEVELLERVHPGVAWHGRVVSQRGRARRDRGLVVRRVEPRAAFEPRRRVYSMRPRQRLHLPAEVA